MPESATPDFTTLARRPSERLAIIDYIFATPALQETDYLEWKSAYDLSTRPGAASTARQLIGMANRDPNHAYRHAEGHGYVLLGIEPENLTGVPLWDTADIENWLSPFVGPHLRYSEPYVHKDGKNVLFLTVDPPRQGDPIYCLRASSQDPDGRSLREGTIYVRHASKTEPATPTDLDHLTARSATANDDSATIRDLSLELDASHIGTIDPAALADDFRDEQLAMWRAEMLAKLPKPRPVNPLSVTLLDKPIGESRSREEYTAEIDLHVHSVKATPGLWTRTIMRETLKRGGAKLGVAIKNDSEENYENVVVELTIIGLGRGNIHRNSSREIDETLGLPDDPLEWGASLDVQLARETRPIRIGRPTTEPEIEAAGPGEVLVRYPELRVRPKTRHPLPPLLLALPPSFAGTTAQVHWRVTASNAKSDLAGDLELPIPRADHI